MEKYIIIILSTHFKTVSKFFTFVDFLVAKLFSASSLACQNRLLGLFFSFFLVCSAAMLLEKSRCNIEFS